MARHFKLQGEIKASKTTFNWTSLLASMMGQEPDKVFKLRVMSGQQSCVSLMNGLPKTLFICKVSAVYFHCLFDSSTPLHPFTPCTFPSLFVLKLSQRLLITSCLAGIHGGVHIRLWSHTLSWCSLALPWLPCLIMWFSRGCILSETY